MITVDVLVFFVRAALSDLPGYSVGAHYLGLALDVGRVLGMSVAEWTAAQCMPGSVCIPFFQYLRFNSSLGLL